MLKRLTTIACGLLLNLAISAAAAEVVVVVSADSPLENLSRAELTDIYLGRTVRLPNGDPIVPVDQAERAPAHDAFYNKYLERSASQIKAHWSRLIFTGRGRPPRSVSNGEAVAEIVADNPNTIGYIDAGLVNDRLRVVQIE